MKKYIMPNSKPIKPVALGASGVPPPTNITIAEITPTATETHDNTLKIVELSFKNLHDAVIYSSSHF